MRVSVAARDGLLRHFLGEQARDLDATMAPVADQPSWLIPGYLVEGRDAVRALYERTLPTLAEGWIDECIRALDDPTVIHWGASHCTIVYSHAYPMHFSQGWIMIVIFDGDRIASEIAYLTRPDKLSGGDLGTAFDELPGVTRTA